MQKIVKTVKMFLKLVISLNNLLRGKRGGLSLTSVRVTVTEVVPDSPPFWPTISFAWMTSKYLKTLTISCHDVLVCRVPDKRFGVILICFPLWITWHFHLKAFNIFWFFWYLAYKCHGEILLCLCLFEVINVSCACIFLSLGFETYLI